jgi:zeaxanthin glucosyltransferase
VSRRIGFLTARSAGHLYPMMTLAREVERLGHGVTFYDVLQAPTLLTQAGFEVRVLASDGKGKIDQAARSSPTVPVSPSAAARLRILFDALPGALKQDGIEGLVIDQVSLGGASVAQAMDLPYVLVSNSIVDSLDPCVPHYERLWKYRTPTPSRFQNRNRSDHESVRERARPITETINAFRRSRGLVPLESPNGQTSPYAHLTQMPRSLDYPRADLPATFHYLGPWIDRSVRPDVSFPYELLDPELPLIYVSGSTALGTTPSITPGGDGTEFFLFLAKVIGPLRVQLVIAMGGSDCGEYRPRQRGLPILVQHAPQLDLMPRAAVSISLGGMNTVLEALYHGVAPMVFPHFLDHPGVAMRLRRKNAGVVIPLQRLTASRLKAGLGRLLVPDGPCTRSVAALRQEMRARDWVRVAGAIIHQVVETGQPVANGPV